MESPFVDALVIGAGFGGLGAALTLADLGARVVLAEALKYPGGCASSFVKRGHRFDAGATLLSGLDEHQLFGRWQKRYALGLEVDELDPVVELRAPDLVVRARRDREALAGELMALPGAPQRELASFFETQRRVADALWPAFDDPDLLPPLDLRALLRHARRASAYARLAPLLGRTLGSVIAAHGLERFEPLRIYADAVCQITVQCAASEAEAPLALAALDYFHRGTAHVRGGVGALAEALVEAARRRGVEVLYTNHVHHLVRRDGYWEARARRGVIRAQRVFANVLPDALDELTDGMARGALEPLAREVGRGWGARMLYLGARLRGPARHLELVRDPSAPFTRGNHVFVSIGDGPEERAVTVSTHVGLDLDAKGADLVTREMEATLAALAPEVWGARTFTLTASPRTFERFTGRPRGAVGGIPRRAGLHNYARLAPFEPMRDLWMVGDTVFPGQSALASALGGVRAAIAASRGFVKEARA